MNLETDQQRAIITGASSGIGEATALAFAAAGIHLVLIGRSQARLSAVSNSCQSLGVEAKTYCIDLEKIEEIQAKIETIVQECGNIDILVNNAGISYTNNLMDTPLDYWQKVINLNLTSVFQCVLGVLPQMRKRKKGTIVNVSSIAADNAFPGWGAYCVSKAGLLSFSKVLAAEERINGIRVTTVTPGSVNTPLWDTETVRADFDRSVMLHPSTIAEVILEAVMLPRNAVVENITIVPSAGIL
ncbi:MAG: Sepiapterin reductase [Chroococcopsis gigantea SAG 12.99]|jgi:short-subunit dehydrogenase|nr:Sepiapterin reductase [Chroococcopsis gigantea SAG 12.99]